jgi:hypothetical protein
MLYQAYQLQDDLAAMFRTGARWAMGTFGKVSRHRSAATSWPRWR